MKKRVCILLLLSLCLMLSACNYFSQSQAGQTGKVRTVLGNIVLTIQTGSMDPTFSVGDTILCEPVTDPDDLQVGDVIAYWATVGDGKMITVHRILEIQDMGEYRTFLTKGDNNSAPDTVPVHEASVVGKYLRKAILGLF